MIWIAIQINKKFKFKLCYSNKMLFESISLHIIFNLILICIILVQSKSFFNPAPNVCTNLVQSTVALIKFGTMLFIWSKNFTAFFNYFFSSFNDNFLMKYKVNKNEYKNKTCRI